MQLVLGTHPDSAPCLKSTSGGAWFLPSGIAMFLAVNQVSPGIHVIDFYLFCCGTVGCSWKWLCKCRFHTIVGTWVMGEFYLLHNIMMAWMWGSFLNKLSSKRAYVSSKRVYCWLLWQCFVTRLYLALPTLKIGMHAFLHHASLLHQTFCSSIYIAHHTIQGSRSFLLPSTHKGTLGKGFHANSLITCSLNGKRTHTIKKFVSITSWLCFLNRIKSYTLLTKCSV